MKNTGKSTGPMKSPPTHRRMTWSRPAHVTDMGPKIEGSNWNLKHPGSTNGVPRWSPRPPREGRIAATTEPPETSYSRPLSWRECVGVEPTQEQETAPATVLKSPAALPHVCYAVPEHFPANRSRPAKRRLWTVAASQTQIATVREMESQEDCGGVPASLVCYPCRRWCWGCWC